MTGFAYAYATLGTGGAAIEDEGERGAADAARAPRGIQRRRQTLSRFVLEALELRPNGA